MVREMKKYAPYTVIGSYFEMLKWLVKGISVEWT